MQLFIYLLVALYRASNTQEVNGQLERLLVDASEQGAQQDSAGERLRDEIFRDIGLRLISAPSRPIEGERAQNRKARFAADQEGTRPNNVGFRALLKDFRSLARIHRKRNYSQREEEKTSQSGLLQLSGGSPIFSGQKTIRGAEPVNMRLPPRFGKRAWIAVIS